MQKPTNTTAAGGEFNAISVAMRPGFLLVDLMIALILVSVVASVLPMMVATIYHQRQQERFERLAQLELGNSVARLQVHQQLSPATKALSPWFSDTYPAAAIHFAEGTVKSDNSQLTPITITISQPWRDGHPDLHQSLTTWVSLRELDP